MDYYKISVIKEISVDKQENFFPTLLIFVYKFNFQFKIKI